MVGCNQPVVIALMVAIASIPPAAPRQCPIIDYIEWCKEKRIKQEISETNEIWIKKNKNKKKRKPLFHWS